MGVVPGLGSGLMVHMGVVYVGPGSGVEGELGGGGLGLSLQLQEDFWSDGIYLGRPPPREDIHASY